MRQDELAKIYFHFLALETKKISIGRMGKYFEGNVLFASSYFDWMVNDNVGKIDVSECCYKAL